MNGYRERRYRALGWFAFVVAALLLVDSVVMDATNYEQGASHAFFMWAGDQNGLTRAQDLLLIAAVMAMLGGVSMLLGRRPGRTKPTVVSAKGRR